MKIRHLCLAIVVCIVTAFVSQSASAQYLLVKAPSDVVAGEKFTVEVVPMRKGGVQERLYEDKVSLRVDGQEAMTDVPMTRQPIFPGTKRSLLFLFRFIPINKL